MPGSIAKSPAVHLQPFLPYYPRPWSLNPNQKRVHDMDTAPTQVSLPRQKVITIFPFRTSTSLLGPLKSDEVEANVRFSQMQTLCLH